MAERLVRLLALVALVLMPLGMASMPAAAANAPANHEMQMSGGGHCDLPAQPSPDQGDRAAQCAMACAMLLPAAPAMQARTIAPKLALTGTLSPKTTGLHPDTDLPPPKPA